MSKKTDEPIARKRTRFSEKKTGQKGIKKKSGTWKFYWSGAAGSAWSNWEQLKNRLMLRDWLLYWFWILRFTYAKKLWPSRRSGQFSTEAFRFWLSAVPSSSRFFGDRRFLFCRNWILGSRKWRRFWSSSNFCTKFLMKIFLKKYFCLTIPYSSFNSRMRPPPLFVISQST